MSKKIDRITNEHPELIINIPKLIKAFDPSDSGKFIDFMLKQYVKNAKTTCANHQENQNKSFSIITSIYNPQNDIELEFLLHLYHVIGEENLFYLWEFNKHLSENRIVNKDIQQYDSWNDIIDATCMAEIKQKEKEYKKQIITLHDDEEWLLLKPLSFDASLTYGAATKWCTASKNNPEYFDRYSTNGVLVYILNRKTNKKCAMFVDIHHKKKIEVSFWNAIDERVDSLHLDLPAHIMEVLRQQILDKTQLKPNKYFFPKTELKRMDEDKNPRKAFEIQQPLAPFAPRELLNENEQIFEEAQMVGEDEGYDEVEDDLMIAPEAIERLGNLIEENIDRGLIVPMDVIIDDHWEFGEGVNDAEDIVENAEAVLEDNGIRIIRHEQAQDIARNFVNDTNEMLEAEGNLNRKPMDIIVPSEFPQFNFSEPFVPAPWLTKLEITEINYMIEGKYSFSSKRQIHNYAYPNGQVVKVTDTIRNNVVVERGIQEIRTGRNENEAFNPFTPQRRFYNDEQEGEEEMPQLQAFNHAEGGYAMVDQDLPNEPMMEGPAQG